MAAGLPSAVGSAFVAPCGWQAIGRVGVPTSESSTIGARVAPRSRARSQGLAYGLATTASHLAMGLGLLAAAARRRHGKEAVGAVAAASKGSRLCLVARRAEQPNEEPKTPATPAAPRVPSVPSGDGTIDVMSKLLKDRVLILGGQVNDDLANTIIAQMLYLAKEDDTKDITIYINSPGGSVSAGFAIYDHMQLVKCDVSTVCFGMAASMGAFLLGAGTKGKRKCFPSSRVMIHQPLGGAGGQAADIEIQAKEILFLRDILNTYLADFTGKPLDQIEKDCDRDYFMTAEEAAEYGIIDEIIKTKTYPRLQKPTKPEL